MSVSSDVLRRVPLFSGMTDRCVEAIGELAHEVDFEAGRELVRQGEPGESFLVLLAGEARVEQGGQQIRDLGPGDFLGEISLIDGGPRTATVTATQPVRALVVERPDFVRLIDDFPPVRLEILTALTQRIRRQALPLD